VELIELMNLTHPMNCSHWMSVKELIGDLDFYILAGNAQKRALKGLDYRSWNKKRGSRLKFCLHTLRLWRDNLSALPRWHPSPELQMQSGGNLLISV